VSRPAQVIDAAIEVGVVALAMFAPLPLGSVMPWAQTVIEGGVALLLALSIVRMAMLGELEIRRTPLLGPAVAMAVLVGWQLLSPGASINRYATWESARLYFAYFGLLLVVGWLPMTRARLVRMTAALVGWAVILAGVGFAAQLGAGWAGLTPGSTGRLTSTFVNPNHQALYFSMALFLALGLLLRPPAHSRRGYARRSESASATGVLESLAARVLLVGGVLVLALALGLTLSRGGLVSTAAALLAMLALALTARTGSRVTLAILAIALVVVTYAGWVGLGAVTDRFSVAMRDPASDLRPRIWTATLRLVGDAPVAGIGLGAFRDAFSPHQPVESLTDKFVDYAHNDFLQLLAEAGVLGLLIAVWATVALLAFLTRAWCARRDPFVRGFLLGGTGAIVAVIVHSFVDFGLHLPGNAVMLVVAAGLLPLAATLHRDGGEERVGLDRWSWHLSPQWAAASVLVATAGVVAAAVLLLPPSVAGWERARAASTLAGVWRRDSVPQGDLVRARDDLRTAVAWDRSNPGAWSEFADLSAELGRRAWAYGITPSGARVRDLSVTVRLEAAQPLLADAYEAYRTSLRLRPRSAEAHERFGWLLGTIEGVRQAVQKDAGQVPIDTRLAGALGSDRSLLPEALTHFQEAVRWDPQNANRYRRMGLFALNAADLPDRYEVAAAALRQSVALNPESLDGVIDDLTAKKVSGQILLAAVPRKFEVLLDVGSKLERRGKEQAAAAAFEDAIGLAPTPASETDARLAYARVLIGRKDLPAALQQVRRALVLAPGEAEVFALLATIYTQTNQGAEADMALATAVTLAESGPGPASRRHRVQGELAGLLVQRGQWERATTLWRQILRDKPNDAWVHLELGRLLEQRRQSAEAFQEYLTAAAVGGEDWRLHRAVARALRDGGYLREAITSFEAARRLHPADGDLGAELGDLYVRVGLADQAIQQYRAVLRRQPDHAAALRGLASISPGAGS
jgi:tetratricopeptide (TPR) repeat protein/O-antigen ligase